MIERCYEDSVFLTTNAYGEIHPYGQGTNYSCPFAPTRLRGTGIQYKNTKENALKRKKQQLLHELFCHLVKVYIYLSFIHIKTIHTKISSTDR